MGKQDIKGIITTCRKGHDNDNCFDTSDFIRWCHDVKGVLLTLEQANLLLQPLYHTPNTSVDMLNIGWYFEKPESPD